MILFLSEQRTPCGMWDTSFLIERNKAQFINNLKLQRWIKKYYYKLSRRCER